MDINNSLNSKDFHTTSFTVFIIKPTKASHWILISGIRVALSVGLTLAKNKVNPSFEKSLQHASEPARYSKALRIFVLDLFQA